MGNLPTIRLSRPTDLNDIVKMDLKIYHYPMELDSWKGFVHTSGQANEAKVIVMEVFRKPVGFAVWRKDDDSGHVYLAKIGVLQKHRRVGLGRMLVAKCEADAQWSHLKKVFLLVPDIHCNPGDPDDVSEFLAKCGYKATGETKEAPSLMYGNRVELYRFEKDLK